MTYIPPQLPNYLSALYDLKPITGIPSDEEVKKILATIRAASNASHIPGMHDPDFSMRLGQHLFDVQMAKYRSRYPCNIFPGDNVYTPPELSSSFSIKLKPITGVPSDEEIKAVRSAVRSCEHLANIPEMFDADVDMNLSQHLFDIQMARYVEHSMMQRFTSGDVQPQSSGPDLQTNATRPAAPEYVGQTPELGGCDENLEDTPKPADGASEHEATPDGSETANKAGCTNLEKCVEAIEGLKAGQEESNRHLEKLGDVLENVNRVLGQAESNRHLEKIGDVLENVNRVLVATQRSIIRASDAHYQRAAGTVAFESPKHHLVNEKGELPRARGLPELKWTNKSETGRVGYPDLSEVQLVKYLRFYNIGSGLISTGNDLRIVSGKRLEAEQLLRNYVARGAL